MNAIVLTEYGPPEVLHLTDIEKPAPKDTEIFVKVYATTIGYGDLVARNFKSVTPSQFNMPFIFWLLMKLVFGFSKPRIKILGSEFSGQVESVGSKVTKFKMGDEVFGFLSQNMGAYAEYLCIPETGCVTYKPTNMTFEEAATVPYGSIMALSLLKQAKLLAGQKLLIIGASGGIGSAAVQIAKSIGAEVTGTCSPPRLEFVQALGADKVLDYTKEDFTRNGETYNIILDILGRSNFDRCRNSLKPNGLYLCASFKMKQIGEMIWTSLFGKQKVKCAIAPGSVEDLISVKQLVEAGKIKAIIDKVYPLEQTANAHRYVERGHKKANVVITIKSNSILKENNGN